MHEQQSDSGHAHSTRILRKTVKIRPRTHNWSVIAAYLLAGFVLLLGMPTFAQPRPSDLTLRGKLSAADHQTYLEIPFRVPTGTVRMTVEFTHSGQSDRTVIDLGLRDPQRFRGWSGGDKSRVVIENADATPSYLAGPLPAGTWRLLLGVPNIRPAATATFAANFWFDRASDPFPGFLPEAIRSEPGWYRGDLHLHTAHSDGSCLSRRGVRAPCPVFKTLEAARARGLDFVAVSDHNTTSQNQALRELAPYFDDLLLIPAREITTFQGHINVFGPTVDLDFQLGSAHAPTLAKILNQADVAHGLVSINHPGLPSGEACMGCGWTADTEWGRIAAMEVINGGTLAFLGPEGPLSGLASWEHQLNAGRRITAIGGSDNHQADLPTDSAAAVGRPTTVVHASELSQAAILTAIRKGHVFVDVWGSADRNLEVIAQAGTQQAEMGDSLLVHRGARVSITVRVKGVPAGARISLAGDAVAFAKLTDTDLTAQKPSVSFEVLADDRPRWLRVDVRGPDHTLLLLGNPIYLRPLR